MFTVGKKTTKKGKISINNLGYIFNMGRNSTGANTVNSTKRIEMKDLIKWGYFKEFTNYYSTLSRSDGSKISIVVINQPDECYIRLLYTLIDNYKGEKTEIDYKVLIERVPSNLGKGSVLYFICPFTHNKCRILYRTYGCHYYMSRQAYHKRIYYYTQLASKKYVSSERCRTAEAKLEKISKLRKRNQTTFKGRFTKNYFKTQKLKKKISELDDKKSQTMYYWLQKEINKYR